MTTTRQRLTAAIAHVEWLIAPPHALHSVIGIYAEMLAGKSMRFRHGASSTEILQALAANGIGGHAKGGHSDPTARAALAREPEADDGNETIRRMRTAETDLIELTYELAGRLGASTTTSHRGLHAVSLIAHRCLERLDDDPTVASIVSDIADTAAWLHEKALWIWQAARGEALPVADTSVKRKTCVVCTPLGRDVVPERGDRCARCKDFIRENKGLRPTAKIARWWEDHPRTATPPRLIAEARFEEAQAKREDRAKRKAGVGA